MSDLQAAFAAKGIDWAKESQRIEGGPNAVNNCIPDAASICLMAEGLPDLPPQQWVNEEYGLSYHGGTDFAHAVDFIHKHYLSAPDLRISNPRDTIGAINGALASGFPLFVQCLCDADAAYVTSPVRINGQILFHMGIPVAVDAANVTIRNVYWGKLHVIPRADFLKMTWDPAGWMMVFARSILPQPAPVPAPADPCADVKASLILAVDQLKAQTELVGRQQAELTGWHNWFVGAPK